MNVEQEKGLTFHPQAYGKLKFENRRKAPTVGNTEGTVGNIERTVAFTVKP
ncbi:MAG: hypothetical protein GY816_01215 [Cytophagales bacterium]|nr:hypothetical protein [Cytophagales bacterium]